MKMTVTFDQDDETLEWVYSCVEAAVVGVAPTLQEAQQMAGEALGVATDVDDWEILEEEGHRRVSLDYHHMAAV